MNKVKNKLKKVHKIVGIMLSVAILTNVQLLEVSAAELNSTVDEEIEIMECSVGEVPEGYFDYLQKARAAFSDCLISVGCSSEGMDIEIMTGTNATVPVIGVKDIRVEQKMWYGWKLVAVSSGAEDTDASGISVHVVFTGAIKDKTYRVTCIHYADMVYDDVEEYVEGFNNTGDFIFTY